MINIADWKVVTDVVISPARGHLRNVDPDCGQLDSKKSESFHSSIATLLCIMKRARPDLEIAISFLCTKASKFV